MQIHTQKGNSTKKVNKEGYEMFTLSTKKCKLKQQRRFEK